MFTAVVRNPAPSAVKMKRFFFPLEMVLLASVGDISGRSDRPQRLGRRWVRCRRMLVGVGGRGRVLLGRVRSGRRMLLVGIGGRGRMPLVGVGGA